MRERPIVVLTNQRDLAADDIIRRIDESGYPVHRLNADSVVCEPVTLWSPDQLMGFEPGAIWWRQFELPASGTRTAADIEDLLIVRGQWRAWISVFQTSEAVWVNDIWSARRAENKIEQLRTAFKLGFEVPPTIVTNDPAEARRFASNCNAVVKTLAGAYYEISELGFVYTHTLDATILEDTALWNSQPLVVQEAISGENIRVILVGDTCFGAICETDELDWRTAGLHAVWQQWAVPTSLAKLCLEYAQAMGLRYAAFDFMRDSRGTWFLEANQAGEWVFLDRRLKLGVSEALATYLRDAALGRKV